MDSRRLGYGANHHSASSRITLIRSDLPSKPMPGSSGMTMWPSSTRTPSGKPPIGLEQVGIALVAAEAEAGRDVERHLVAAVRDAARRRPAVLLEHVERAQIFDQAVGQRAVELQPVAVRPHAAVAQQVARVLMREQVLAGRHRARIELGERGLQRVVERIAGLLVPEQRIVAQHLGVGDRGLEVEAAVGVDRELRLARRSPPAPPRCARRSSAIGAPPIFIFTTV